MHGWNVLENDLVYWKELEKNLEDEIVQAELELKKKKNQLRAIRFQLAELTKEFS